ncbi:MAG: hypothetical protein HY814_14855 [Candidatus Riflebacteria bacterium]|nr:hypothetical protein [Candidatus Riflebacteria bacterium]
MDFTKIQQQRRSQETRHKVLQLLGVMAVFLLLAGLWPYLQRRELRQKVSVSADSFLVRIRSGDVSGAWSSELTTSLRKQHPKAQFETIFRGLLQKKGSLASWTLQSFASHPDGKPYDLLEYNLTFERGIATLLLAVEMEQRVYKVRAYRLRATGL